MRLASLLPPSFNQTLLTLLFLPTSPSLPTFLHPFSLAPPGLHLMHLASCTMHLAPCTLHPAPYTLHLSFTFPSSLYAFVQLRAVQSGVALQDSRHEHVRTPRRRNYRDRDNGRNASGSGLPYNPARSRSPVRRTPHTPAHRRSSPPPYNQHQSPSKNSVFPFGTASQGLPVCALCLATDPHDTRKCRSETLWDGSKARCSKSDEGRLITPAGTTLCSDWNNRRGCSISTHEQRHECSGCGNKDHGAQRCPRAQKKPSAHPL